MAPKSVPLRRVIRMAAASATGATAAAGIAASVHTRRIPQNPCAKNSPNGINPPNSAPMTMTCRQSLALSAILPDQRG